MVLVFALLTGARLELLGEYSAMLDCDGCLASAALWRELELLLWLVCADLAARRWLPKLAWLVRLLVVAAVLICALDWWVLQSFLVRLDWREVQKFWGDLDSAAFFLRLLADQAWWQVLGIGLGVVALLGIFVGYIGQRWRFPGWCLPVSLGLLVLNLGLAPGPRYHDVYVRHALAAFANPSTLHNVYSPTWIEAQMPRLREAASQRICVAQPMVEPGPTQVVLVVVESLSSYQSQAYGGVHDWTPRLDDWSAKGRSFTHFLANGKTTEDGLFALLTGQVPVLQSGRRTMFESALDPARPALPQLLGQAGYLTAFMTTGNLAFMQKRAWLERIGFEVISGHDDPFYDGMRRYHFDAAVDAALYGRARQWMQQQGHKPYFLALETVSSHQPYFDPVGQTPSIEGAFRYADAALGEFLDHLEADGFFEQGLVIVTSDHRAMVPSSAQARENLGQDYQARVPLLMLGRSAPVERVSDHFSQQDLLPSLQQLLMSGETCRYVGQGLWNAGRMEPADCTFMVRAQYPDREFVQCGAEMFQILLNADQSRYLDPKGPQAYLDAIHAHRVPVFQRPAQAQP